MSIIPARTVGGEEPSAAELAAIAGEWPAIEAEVALVAAEIQVLTVTRPSALDWRRLRRAEHRALAARHYVYGTPAPAGSAAFGCDVSAGVA